MSLETCGNGNHFSTQSVGIELPFAKAGTGRTYIGCPQSAFYILNSGKLPPNIRADLGAIGSVPDAICLCRICGDSNDLGEISSMILAFAAEHVVGFPGTRTNTSVEPTDFLDRCWMSFIRVIRVYP